MMKSRLPQHIDRQIASTSDSNMMTFQLHFSLKSRHNRPFVELKCVYIKAKLKWRVARRVYQQIKKKWPGHASVKAGLRKQGKARIHEMTNHATVSICYQVQIKRVKPVNYHDRRIITIGALVTKSSLVSTRSVTNIAVPTMRVRASENARKEGRRRRTV